MRVALLVAVLAVLAVLAAFEESAPAQEAKTAPKDTAKGPPPGAAKDTAAAERTRTKLLKVKVTVDYDKRTLRDLLKELAGQAGEMSERQVMWTYAEGVPADALVTFSCKNKPLDEALDDLCKKLMLGYVVVSKEDDKHDGWVRITKGSERGYDTSPPPIKTIDGDDDEQKAAGRLGIAKDLIDKGKPADAKAVLMLVMNKFPKTKAAAEAKELLEKLNK